MNSLIFAAPCRSDLLSRLSFESDQHSRHLADASKIEAANRREG